MEVLSSQNVELKMTSDLPQNDDWVLTDAKMTQSDTKMTNKKQNCIFYQVC